MTKAYQSTMPGSPYIGVETQGQLPPERIDIVGDFGGPAAAAEEPSVLAVVPDATVEDPGLLHVYRLSDLLPAASAGSGSGAPVGSFTASAVHEASFLSADPLGWKPLLTTAGVPLALTIAGGFGRSVVSASIPLSASSSGSRRFSVRLVVDGVATGETSVTPGSNSTAGNTNTVSFAAATWLLPPVRTHSLRAEAWSPGGVDITIYSAGATITATEAPTQAVGGVGGDLDGTLPDPTVVAIQARAVSSAAPTSGDALVWDGSEWAPGVPTVDTHDHEIAGDVTGASLGATTVEAIQGRAIGDIAPTDGQALVWSDANSRWEPGTVASAGATILATADDLPITGTGFIVLGVS